MESPIPTLVMVAVYLYIVVFLGPWLMANRKPFKLKTVLVVYNAAQVLFSLAMLWEVRVLFITYLHYNKKKKKNRDGCAYIQLAP